MSSNPKYIGPGFWASWHIRTLNYIKKEEKMLNKKIIEWDIFNFPCMECRGHAVEYLAKNPIIIDEDQYSLFKWTVDFHNTVNMRLGKEYIDFDDAKKMWSGENICLQDCEGEVPVELGVKGKEEEEEDYIYRSY